MSKKERKTATGIGEKKRERALRRLSKRFKNGEIALEDYFKGLEGLGGARVRLDVFGQRVSSNPDKLTPPVRR